MQEIATKVAKVIKHAPEGWTRDDVRHLIHGVGGSPRRAKRLLRADEEQAAEFRDAFASDIDTGTHFVKAVQAANERYAAAFGTAQDHAEPEDKPEPKPAQRRASLTQLALAIPSAA